MRCFCQFFLAKPLITRAFATKSFRRVPGLPYFWARGIRRERLHSSGSFCSVSGMDSGRQPAPFLQ
jgi:hypothetical protein